MRDKFINRTPIVWPILCVCCLIAIPSTLLAQLPATRLSSLSPPTCNAGQSFDLTIAGTDLDNVNILQFSHPGITAKQKMAEPGPFDKGPQPVVNQFVVAVAGNVPPGLYEARAQGLYGLSNPRAFLVSEIPIANEVEPNDNIETATEINLPAMIGGQSNRATDVDFYKFNAKAGERIIASGYARAIDSKIDTVLIVYDSMGRQLASSRDDKGLDSLIDLSVKTNDQYILEVRDAAYRGGPDYPYCISVGVLPHIDYIFPPVGKTGTNGPFEIFGRNLPDGKPSGLTCNGRPLDKISLNIPVPNIDAALNQKVNDFLMPATAGIDLFEHRIKSPAGLSNPVLIGISNSELIHESDQNDRIEQAQQIKTPCEVVGQFFPARDQDWFQFDAKKDESLTMEVISQRMGIQTNPMLYVQQVVKPAEGENREQTRQLSFSVSSGTLDGAPEFDIRNDDPMFEFKAPADGTYRIMVRDTYNDIRSDPRRVYRLAIHGDQPDFRLVAIPVGSHSSMLLRKGGQAGIRVVAFRRDGFEGEIKVATTGLPAKVTCEEVIIGPKSSSAMLVLVAAADAPANIGTINVSGKATVGKTETTRVARFGMALDVTVPGRNPSQAVEGRIARNMVLSISEKEIAPITLQAGDGKVWENSRGARFKIPYTRGGTFKGAIRIQPRGFPANVNAQQTNLAANATKGEFDVRLSANTPTGTYTFYLEGVANQVDYTRNPEAGAAAAQRKKEVDEIKKKADADSKAATAAKVAADQLVTSTTNAVKATTTAKTAAEKALSNTTTSAKTATDIVTKAKAALAAKPDDANLKTAVTNAEKAATNATVAVKTATEKLAAAQKSLDEATAKAKTAAEAKVVADKKATEMSELAKLATALKTKTDQLAVTAANAARPGKRNVQVISTPITLKITDAPITFAEPVAANPIKQGEKLEVPLKIVRLYEFKNAVNVNTVLPGGVGGLSIPNLSIPADKLEGKLVINAAANATEGEHTLTVRITANLNGQNLVVEQPLKIKVEKVVPPKK